MWKRISSLTRFTKKVDSAQNTREKTEENLERDLVNSKKERSSEKFKTPRNCKENSGDEIFRILSEMSKKEKKLLIVCLRELSCVCRKKKLISG